MRGLFDAIPFVHHWVGSIGLFTGVLIGNCRLCTLSGGMALSECSLDMQVFPSVLRPCQLCHSAVASGICAVQSALYHSCHAVVFMTD